MSAGGGALLDVGVLGLGRMGGPIAERLAQAGHRVSGFDVDGERLAAASASGVRAADDARGLARSVDVLLTVLPGAAELRPVLGGAGGVLSALRPGTLWLDLTSGDPRATDEFVAVAEGVGALAGAAPMGGGPADAQAGTLRFYLAGRGEAVGLARRVLAPLVASADAIVEIGPAPAAAQTVKLLANLLWFGQVAAVTEAMLLGAELGLEPGLLRRLLGGSAAASVLIERHLPLLLAGDYMGGFGLDRVVEELDTATALADEHGVPFRMSQLAATLHREALDAFGPVDGELLVARLLEERAGRELRG